MKKIIIMFFTLLWSISAFSADINKLIFFGDSLSDNGNLYHVLFGVMPKSPPYYLGRFSNGPTWAEHLGNYYYDKSYADYKIYAYGGATAIYHHPSKKFIAPTLLEIELDQYLLESAFQDRSRTLFSIWIGGNDYLYDQASDPDIITDKIISTISTLIHHGAKYFLILNLPDLSQIPFAHMGDSSPAKLKLLAEMHNEMLAGKIKQLQKDYPNVKIHFIDTYAVFSSAVNDINAFNQTYHVNIQNSSEACWQGMPLLSKGTALSVSDKQQLLAQNLDPNIVEDFMQTTPDIREAYRVVASYHSGLKPCANADEYLFWDAVHPTAVIHRIIAQIVEKTLST